MRIHVDGDKCQGHNRCYSLAPALFELDDYGTSHEVGDGTVPADLEEHGPARGGELPRVRNLDQRGVRLMTDLGNKVDAAAPEDVGDAHPDHDTAHDPVEDWATDFNHLDPEWAADPYSIQDELRQRCPIAHSERFGGVWLPTQYDDIAAIAYDTDHFSSRTVVVSTIRPASRSRPSGCPAHHLRSAVSSRRAQAAAACVHQGRYRQTRSRDSRVLP